MQPVITVDTREFQRVAEALVRTSSRTFPQFVNGQMFKLALTAIKTTEKADRYAIEHQMGTISRTETLRGGSAGAKGWVRITKRKMLDNISASFAARIVNARRKARGEEMIWGKELVEAARKMVAAKIKSVAFIKSGWIPAIQTLKAIVYGRGASLAGAKQVGAPKGYAIPAIFMLSGVVSCEIGNTALLHQSKHSAWHGKAGNPMPIAQRGLQLAITIVTRDMADEFYKRTARDLAPYGARLGP